MGKKRVKFNLQTASCGPCLRQTETDVKAAKAFCKSCNDFLCNECIKPHRRLVAMENHVIINRDHVLADSSLHESSGQSWDEILETHKVKIAEEMAKLNPDVLVKYEEFRKQTLESMKQVDVKEEEDSFEDIEDIVIPELYRFTEPCPEHNDEFIKYYCQSHDKLCCEICKLVHHKHCLSKVKFIPDEIGDSDGKYKADPFVKINKLVGEFKDYDKNLQNDIRELKRSKEAFLHDVQVKKREILNWVNLMEVRAVRRLDIVFDRCKRELDTNRKKSKEAREELRAESYFLKEIIANENNNDVYRFIKSKTAEKVVEACANKRGHRKFTNTRFAMKLNPDFDKVKEEINHLYELKFETKGEDKYSVRLKDDKYVSNVTGCTFFPNGNIVIADSSNSKIKQFSPNFRQLSSISLSEGVFDTCAINSNTVVVTSPSKSKLQVLDFNSEITVARAIDAGPGSCYGVTHHDDMLFLNITMEDSNLIRVMDITGKVLCNVDTIQNHYSIIRLMEDEQINTECNIVTVTSFVERSQEEIEFYVDEKVIPERSMTLSQYNYLNHLHTKGVALDRHDNVVVCCPDVDQIFTISKSGDEAELMLAESDGLCRPQSLVYNADKSTLLVTSENTDFVQLFKYDGLT